MRNGQSKKNPKLPARRADKNLNMLDVLNIDKMRNHKVEDLRNHGLFLHNLSSQEQNLKVLKDGIHLPPMVKGKRKQLTSILLHNHQSLLNRKRSPRESMSLKFRSLHIARSLPKVINHLDLLNISHQLHLYSLRKSPILIKDLLRMSQSHMVQAQSQLSEKDMESTKSLPLRLQLEVQQRLGQDHKNRVTVVHKIIHRVHREVVAVVKTIHRDHREVVAVVQAIHSLRQNILQFNQKKAVKNIDLLPTVNHLPSQLVPMVNHLPSQLVPTVNHLPIQLVSQLVNQLANQQVSQLANQLVSPVHNSPLNNNLDNRDPNQKLHHQLRNQQKGDKKKANRMKRRTKVQIHLGLEDSWTTSESCSSWMQAMMMLQITNS